MMRALLSLLSPAGARGRLTTLIFHRVLREPDPLFPEEMHARRFDELCAWLRLWFNVLALDEAIVRLRAGTLPARALCITFDDGYEDNHSVALPILLRHRLSATFFIATGFLDGGQMWNDTVIESIRRAPGDRIDLRGLPMIELGVYDLSTVALRRAAVDATLPLVKYLPIAERLAAVHTIAQRAGVEPRGDLMMSSEQVRAMRQSGMQIGAHTVNHPILATLAVPDMKAEMLDSKSTLESILAEKVVLFAYPNGRPGRDYGLEAVSVARSLGFLGAVSTAPGVAKADADEFQLPRFTPWDRSRTRFGARLARNLLAA